MEVDERKGDKPQANRLQRNTGLQCHALQNHQTSLHCNTEHNPPKQETGNSFLMETNILLSNIGLANSHRLPKAVYLELVEQQ